MPTAKCDTLTADVSQLYAHRLNMTKPADQSSYPIRLQGAARARGASATTTG